MDDEREDPCLAEWREPLRFQWLTWMHLVAAEGPSEKIASLLETSERLLADGYPGPALVTAFTALEVCGHEVVLDSLLGGLLWPLGDLVDHLVDSIFGRNGRVQNLKSIWEKGFRGTEVGDTDISADVWTELAKGQELRNKLLHRGEQVPTGSSEAYITAVKVIVNHILSVSKVVADASLATPCGDDPEPSAEGAGSNRSPGC